MKTIRIKQFGDPNPHLAGLLHIAGRILKLGDNVRHRICRPAWTTESFESHNHRYDRGLEKDFFIKSGGFYRKKEQNVAHTGTNRGRRK
jgi:hypothetical protein